MNTVLDVVKNGGSLEDAQAQVDAKIKQWFEGAYLPYSAGSNSCENDVNTAAAETQAPELKKKLATKMTSLGYTCGTAWLSSPVSKDRIG